MFAMLVLSGAFKVCSAVACYLRVYAPTNIALDYFRSGRGLDWAIPAALLLAPTYWSAGYATTTAIATGGPGWLNLLAALCAWNGIKFAALGLWTPLQLLRAAVGRRAAGRLRSQAGTRPASRVERWVGA
jgi:hypothetical protein